MAISILYLLNDSALEVHHGKVLYKHSLGPGPGPFGLMGPGSRPIWPDRSWPA